MKCAICGKEIAGWGNNPWPIRKSEEAKCCDECNSRYVITGRLLMMNETPEWKNWFIDMIDSKSPKQIDVLFDLT